MPVGVQPVHPVHRHRLSLAYGGHPGAPGSRSARPPTGVAGTDTRRWLPRAVRVTFEGVSTESVVPDAGPPRSKLTGGQTWTIAGLLVLQIPWSLLFFPLAAIFAITGIFVPVAIVLMGVGTLPFSYAMRCRDRWQALGVPEEPTITRPVAPAGDRG